MQKFIARNPDSPMLVNASQNKHLNLSRHTRLVALGIAVLCVAVSGCEDVPQLASATNITPIGENTVTSSGRGSYDWYVVNGNFDVTAPSELEVLSQIDGDLVRKSLSNLTFTERTEPYRPEGMEDDVYYTFRRYTEPYLETQPFLTIPFQASGDGMFSVNSAGDRLVVLGKQIEVWDLKSSTRLTASPLPSPKCTRVIWDFNPDHVLVMDNAAIYRIAAATGQVLMTWKPPQSDEPAFVVRAANSNTCAVSTKKKKMYALGEGLQTIHEFKGPPLDSHMISIRPDANWVLGLSNGNVIRWHISPNPEVIETLGGAGKETPILQIVAGNLADFLVDPYTCAICYKDLETQQLKIRSCDLNPLAHAGGMGTVDGNQEWFTACMSRPDTSGKRQYFVQDLMLEIGVFSVEFPLGPEPVLEMSLDQLTEICAVRDAQQLRIYRRQRWKDVTGAWTVDRLTKLALDGRFEQLELTAIALRKQPRLRSEFSENFYNNLAIAIGRVWAHLEADKPANINSPSNDPRVQDENTKSILESLEDWKTKGSELAILSSGYRHSEIGRRARGAGLASTVTQAGWDEFEKRNQKIQLELRPLRKLNSTSQGLLILEIESGLDLGKSTEDLQPVIKQLVELYPFTASGHSNLCVHMLPRWGGKAGEGGAYLATVADLLPKPYGDLLYTRVASAFGKTFQNTIFSPQESGISIGRILRSVEPLLECNELWQDEVEYLITLASATNQLDLAEKLARYHVRHYTLNRFEQTSYERSLLRTVKMEMAK